MFEKKRIVESPITNCWLSDFSVHNEQDSNILFIDYAYEDIALKNSIYFRSWSFFINCKSSGRCYEICRIKFETNTQNIKYAYLIRMVCFVSAKL